MSITFVTAYVSPSFDSTSPKTLTPTVAVGDCLVLVASTANLSPTEPFATAPSGTGLVVTSRQSLFNGSTTGDLHVWTATVTTGGSPVVSLPCGFVDTWVFGIYRYSGVSAVGTSVSAAAAGTTISITPGVANAAVFLVMNDGNGAAGLPTANTTAGAYTNESNVIDSGNGSLYAGHYISVGTAGAKTVGVSAPTGPWSIIAVELQPSITNLATIRLLSQAVKRAAYI
jgi:hypothetical protein